MSNERKKEHKWGDLNFSKIPKNKDFFTTNPYIKGSNPFRRIEEERYKYFLSGTPPKNPLDLPTQAPPPSEANVVADIEKKIINDARKNGKELVLNPLHPENRRPVAQPDDDFFERINSGIRGTGEAHRKSGGQQVLPFEPDDY